jgi:hypothetical protein
MIHDNFSCVAAEFVLKTAGVPFPRLSRLGTPVGNGPPTKVYHARFPAPEIGGFSFFLVDVTVEEDGTLRLIEANTSNAALSSCGAGDDDRARHMAQAFERRVPPGVSVVALLAFQPGFIHLPEWFSRAAAFAQHLSQHRSVGLRAWDEKPGREDVAVICGAIPELAALIEVRDRKFFVHGREVVFMTNPNALAELVRLRKIARQGTGYACDLSVFHEGAAAALAHDKGRQQDLAQGTSIKSLAWRDAPNFECALDALDWFADRGMVAMAKMNAGSGGAGVQPFTPDLSRGTRAQRLDKLVQSARDKHGPEADETLYPIRIFEFAKARPYPLHGHQHLWDLRVQALVSPGHIDARACVVRLCPAPFDGSYSWDSVVSNLTGRDPARAMRYMRAPGAQRRSMPGTVLQGLGLTEDDMQRVLEGCAQWAAAAWCWSNDPSG